MSRRAIKKKKLKRKVIIDEYELEELRRSSPKERAKVIRGRIYGTILMVILFLAGVGVFSGVGYFVWVGIKWFFNYLGRFAVFLF
jgi:hypothetical protein